MKSISVSSLADLLALDAGLLGSIDIALVNLLCAESLPGTDRVSVRSCLNTLDNWTDAVRRYTKANACFYKRDSAAYGYHKGFSKLVSMAVMLKRGLGIGYQPTAIGNFDFSDARDDFLQGVLTRKLGTCTSLPVLVVAIGRRLGYPVHLAIARGHVLCQWLNDDGTHVNFEISGNDGDCSSHKDEHYHAWPHPLTRDQIASGRHLRPLTPQEELSLFLSTRAHCLCDNGHYRAAAAAYRQARDIAPKWSLYEEQMKVLRQMEWPSPRLHAAPTMSFGTIVGLSGIELRTHSRKEGA